MDDILQKRLEDLEFQPSVDKKQDMFNSAWPELLVHAPKCQMSLFLNFVSPGGSASARVVILHCVSRITWTIHPPQNSDLVKWSMMELGMDLV